MEPQFLSTLEDLCIRACVAANGAVEARTARSQAVASEGHEVDAQDEVIQIDRDTSARILEVLALADISMDVVIEEKMAPIHLSGRVLAQGLTAYIDPFDGSKLFKRGFRAFWVSAIGFIAGDTPLASGVVEHVERVVYSSDSAAVHAQDLARGPAMALAWRRAEGPGVVGDWYVGAYAMAPEYFLRVHERLSPLIRRIRCFIPNGGPMGFVDVLTGRLDLYIGMAEAVTEVLPSLALANAGGLHVTNFDGSPLRLASLDRTSRVDFLCARSQSTIETARAILDSRDVAPGGGA